MSPSTKKRTALLKRRLRYHGLDMPVVTAEERRKARSAILKKKRASQLERQIERTYQKALLYNETHSGSNGRDTFKISRETLSKIKPDKLSKLSKTFNDINKRKDIVKNKKKLFEQLNKINNPYAKKPPRSSIRVISAAIEDKRRKDAGQLSQLDELYYENFKKAALRKGVYSLYRKAEKRGWEWVVELYDRGFDINDVYEAYAEGINDTFHSDREIDSFIKNPSKIPKQDSDLGKWINARFRIR